ncbi:MAG: TraC family protein [Candidatus Omnitrophota bacterium]
MLTMAGIEGLFHEGKSLPDFLPYAEYADGVFLHVDGSVGRLWELSLHESEAAGSARVNEVSTMIGGFTGRIPSGMSAQCVLLSDSDISRLMGRYGSLTAADMDRAAGMIIDGKVRHIQESRNGFFKGAGEGVFPRKMRLFFSLRSYPAWKGDGHGAKDWERIRADFLRACRVLESQWSFLPVPAEEVDEDGLVALLYRILNPRRAEIIPAPRLNREFLREQVLYNAPEVRGNGFVFDGSHTRVLSLKELPQATWPGMLSAMEGLCDIHRDMMIVVNFTVPEQSAALSRIKVQKTLAFLQRTSSWGDTSEEALQKKEDLSGVITQTFKGGKVIVQARFHILLWGDVPEVLERACDSILMALHRMGAEGLREEVIAPSIFLTCLPLNFDHRIEPFIRRERRMLSDNFADMLPFYGACRGTETPAALYLNRRGEPVGIDFFDSATNPHGLVTGVSGAGKSFLINDFIYQNYRLGAHFFVLDKGHSYRKTCDILGGQYIDFDLRAPLTINPFLCDPGSENLAFLVEVLALMASGGDDRDRLAREERGFLQQAVLAAYNGAAEGEVTLSDVVRILDGDSGMGARIALRLAPFTRKGPYGKFFDGPNQFSVNSRFTVFELANLSAYPDLQLVVLLNIMFFVTQFIADTRIRGERKFMLIDEAWQLLKMANTADFIANAFKTFRKYRCAAVAVTQEVADLLQQKSGLAILANTANKIFLQQEHAMVERLRHELSLSDEVAALLGSVRTVKGRYAEALVMTSSSSGVIRLVPDPFLYWAATSEPRDNACLDQERENSGGDLLDALDRCARKYPGGVR